MNYSDDELVELVKTVLKWLPPVGAPHGIASVDRSGKSLEVKMKDKRVCAMCLEDARLNSRCPKSFFLLVAQRTCLE
jgi:hypothetical protein